MLGVAVLGVLCFTLIWMAINNHLDGMGKPKIHIHRYGPTFYSFQLEECRYHRCKKTRVKRG